MNGMSLSYPCNFLQMNNYFKTNYYFKAHSKPPDVTFSASIEQIQANGQQAGSIWVLLECSGFCCCSDSTFGAVTRQHRASPVSMCILNQGARGAMSGESALLCSTFWTDSPGRDIEERTRSLEHKHSGSPALTTVSSLSLTSQTQDDGHQESMHEFQKDSHSAHSSHILWDSIVQYPLVGFLESG